MQNYAARGDVYYPLHCYSLSHLVPSLLTPQQFLAKNTMILRQQSCPKNEKQHALMSISCTKNWQRKILLGNGGKQKIKIKS